MPKMTREAASRIQSSTCRNNGGVTPKNSFAARALSSAYRNEPKLSPSNDHSCSQSLCKVGLFAAAVVVGVGVIAGMKAIGTISPSL